MRKAFGISLASLMLSLAGSVQAMPQILIYNYTAPVPALELVSQSPKDHEEFQKSPPLVRVSFTEAVDEDASELKVYDPYNNVIASRGKMTKDTAMEAELPPNLLAGSYRVEWKATCSCSAKSTINGSSYFTIY